MRTYTKEKLELFKKVNENRARLLINCADQPGIVAAVSKFLYEHDANILESSQYSTNPQASGEFFMRIEFEIKNLQDNIKKLEEDFKEIESKFQMEATFKYVKNVKKMRS